MSELESIAKLRGLPFHGTNGFGNCVTASKETINSIADEIEREVAERFMELPCDADGVPIRVGNAVEFGENRNRGIVKALNEHMVIAMHVDDSYTNYAKYGLLWNAAACRHVKPRTLEDVMRDVWKEALDYAKSDVWRNPDEVFAERADEIRAMFGEVGE